MKIELLVSEWCPSCHQAEKIWREVSQERDFEFAVVDMSQPEGRALVSALRLKTIPALVIDGELKGIGVQSLAEARALVAQAPPKARTSLQHAGLSFSADNRFFVLAAVGYLMLAGAGLAIDGALLTEGPARPAVLHLLTLGFLLFLIFGLGAHMLPRFTGNPIRTGAWPWAQMALAHAGVAGYALGYLAGWHGAIIFGAVCAWLALLLFAIRIWPVLWREPAG
ncbi:MAG: thioredoxin family protein [Pseudomonadota bacterium]